MSPGDQVWVRAEVVHTDSEGEVRVAITAGDGVTDDKVYVRTRDVLASNREHQVFDTPVVGMIDGAGIGAYHRIPRGQGATRYVVSDEDLLLLVRDAKRVQAIRDFLEEFGTGGQYSQAIWEFLNKDKPLPTLKEMPRDD